ncbi:hypothetical protein HOD19_02785, partial [bacterium]|nr:hypothetical protein [bacterium]
MFTTKHNWIILGSVFVMAMLLLIAQTTVFAQWEGPPNNPPDGNITFEYVQNPMADDLYLGGN